MPNDLLAELAQIEHIDDVKQANNDNLALVDGLELYAGNDDILARDARPRRRRRHLRRQPRRRRRRCGAWSTSPSAAPRSTTELAAPSVDALGRHHQPDPHQGGAGPARPPRRRPAPAAGRGRPSTSAATIRARCSTRHGAPGAHALERHAARPPARRAGRDRQEHDGRRVRRPDRRRRRRPALPDRRHDGHRPRPARLHLPARAASTTSRRSSSPTATRTTSAACPSSCASSAPRRSRSTAAR